MSLRNYTTLEELVADIGREKADRVLARKRNYTNEYGEPFWETSELEELIKTLDIEDGED